MKVRNINGTSTNICKCGSWLQHCRNFSGQSLPGYCPEKTCGEKPTVGVRVQKESTADDNW